MIELLFTINSNDQIGFMHMSMHDRSLFANDKRHCHDVSTRKQHLHT
jgi:hypothetical protein